VGKRTAWLGLGMVLCVGAVGAAAPVHAECTTATEARRVQASLRKAMRCAYQQRLDPARACRLAPPPPCAGTLVDDGVALVSRFVAGAGAPAGVDRRAHADRLRCERRIGSASARFVGVMLKRQVRGDDAAAAEARARRALAAVPDRCFADRGASGATRPAPGAEAGAAAAPGTVIDPAVLRDALVAAFAALAKLRAPAPAPRTPPKPNIVLIVTDDQRADTIAARYMPNLARQVVGEGVRFPLGIASNPLCCPSRASLLTGRYAHHHGVLHNARGNPAAPTGGAWAFADASTLATWLRDRAGYRTGMFGKYLNGYGALSDEWAASQGGVHYVPPGWDRWYGLHHSGLGQHGASFVDERGAIVETDPGSCLQPTFEDPCPVQPPGCPHSTDHLRDEALAFIDEAVGLGRRFFLTLSTHSPHPPACPAARHRGRWAHLAPHRPPSWNEGGAGGRDGDEDKPGWLRQQGALDAAGIDGLRIRQLESLRSVDDAVGAILAKLREAGQDANTILVYLGDNGYLWGEHRRDLKSCPYDECLRVPFVVRYPALVRRPRVERAPVTNVDVAPTLAELAGIDPATLEPPVDGRSMRRLLAGTETAWPSEILGEGWGNAPRPGDPKPPIPTFALVRGPRWKYVEYCTGEVELYDLVRDPFELTNVASRNPDVVESQALRLRELNDEWPATLPFACGVHDLEEE